jgi:hypothetical protein
MRIRVLLLCGILFIAFNGYAQTEKDKESDAAKKADIRRLMQLTGQNMKVGEMMRSMIPQFRAAMGQYEKSVSPEHAERFRRVMEEMFEKIILRVEAEQPRLLDMMIPVYVKHLSHEDIKALLQFYESPAGQRFLTAMPLIAQDSFAVLMPWMQQLNNEMMDEMMEAMRKEFPELPFPKKSD